jgi:hypothetical protein
LRGWSFPDALIRQSPDTWKKQFDCQYIDDRYYISIERSHADAHSHKILAGFTHGNRSRREGATALEPVFAAAASENSTSCL